MRQRERLRGPAHRRDAVLVKGDRGALAGPLDGRAEPGPGGHARALLAHLPLDRDERRVVGMPAVDGENGPARDGVGRAGAHPQHPDGDHGRRVVPEGDPVERVDHARGAEQRIPAPGHGQRPGVPLLALDGHLETALALRPEHDADHLALGLEHRPLLDVRLEEGVHGRATHGLAARVADAGELPAHGPALGIGVGQRLLEPMQAGEQRGAHQAGAEARALLVGPDHEVDRRPGPEPGVVQAAHRLQPGEHAVGAVELAAHGLAVQVAAGHDRGPGVVRPGAPREDVAHSVDPDRAARRLAPAHEEVARLLVQVAERQAPDPAVRRGADPAHLH